MEFERYDEGVPSWVDMNSGQIDQAKEFYAGLFGWTCPEGPPEAGGYTVCELRRQDGGRYRVHGSSRGTADVDDLRQCQQR